MSKGGGGGDRWGKGVNAGSSSLFPLFYFFYKYNAKYWIFVLTNSNSLMSV